MIDHPQRAFEISGHGHGQSRREQCGTLTEGGSVGLTRRDAPRDTEQNLDGSGRDQVVLCSRFLFHARDPTMRSVMIVSGAAKSSIACEYAGNSEWSRAWRIRYVVYAA